MAEHITSRTGIAARDELHRAAMEAASHALLVAMAREIEGMRHAR